MKNLYHTFILIFATIVFLVSCSEKQNNEKNNTLIPDTINQTKEINTEINSDSLKNKVSLDTTKEKNKKQIKKEKIIYKYICPLGCKEGNSNIKGNCPNCGMELIENPDYLTKKQTDKK